VKLKLVANRTRVKRNERERDLVARWSFNSLHAVMVKAWKESAKEGNAWKGE